MTRKVAPVGENIQKGEVCDTKAPVFLQTCLSQAVVGIYVVSDERLAVDKSSEPGLSQASNLLILYRAG